MKERMQELVDRLNEAAKAYYSGHDEIMSNYEYDALYDELTALEKKTGIILAGSPTQRVGYEVVGELPKEAHPSRMLSLEKTKSVAELADFAGEHESLLSWKLDGLTVVLTYDDGTLTKAVTRGNGEIGEVITPNAKTFVNLPLRIPFTGHLVLRGEAIITYEDFERINAAITDPAERYKNPRNLCSGTVRQLNSEITAKRRVRVIAFALIEAENVDFGNSHKRQFEWLREQGFDVVEYQVVTAANMEEAVRRFSVKIENNAFPSDGLVLLYDDIAYGASLGTTAKSPKNAIAFKWKDETAETILRDVEWSASRTGLINPVAIFDPVELEGTTVSRASLHNISYIREKKLGIGDRITVYKANMIIPQIAENLTGSDSLSIPKTCPVCNGTTRIESTTDTDTLYCTNPDCQAKHVKSFELFVSRNAMNIEGISEQTLEKFIDCGFIRRFTDLYHMDRHREAIVSLEGFGAKSYENMQASVEASRKTTLAQVIYAMGIAGIGLANAKLICRALSEEPERLLTVTAEELMEIDGIGEVLAGSFEAYFREEKHREEFLSLLSELTLTRETRDENSPIAGKAFVITGAVSHFANRDELKAYIESLGGKNVGSVSAKTDYLINNDVNSSSGKNKKAKELGIPIISEEDFLRMSGKEV